MSYWNHKCSEKVDKCGDKTKPTRGTRGCHEYFKCDNNKKAYSCQNPKFLRSTCSERYFSIGKGKDAYACGPETIGAHDCNGDFDYKHLQPPATR